jgi:hypothetical protein
MTIESNSLELDAARLRTPFRAVDNQDWDYLLNTKLGYGGRDRFWREVLTEMRAALAWGE